MKIQSFDEWSPLKTAIVGTATSANFPESDKLYKLQMSQAGWTKTPPPSGPVSEQIIRETNEDLDALTSALTKLGVSVHRPYPQNFQFTDGQYAYCPRDNLLVVGDRVIEAPMSTRSRQQEMFAYKLIRNSAIRDGARWMAAPHPTLSHYENISDGKFKLNNKEPVFDAANICRFGKQILYLVGPSGNEIGAQWLQNVLGNQYEVVTTDVYNSTHIDSTIVPISEDTVVLNANRVNASNLPDFLKDWNKIYITHDMIVPQDFIGYPYASKWIAINMLAVGNKTVICDKNQPKIIERLEQSGFNVVPLELRHSRTLGGGFHCVTVDLYREVE